MQILPFEHSFDQPLGLLSDCHRRIEKFLAVLTKVSNEAPCELPPVYSQALVKALDYFRDAAPNHTQDEENSLFPRLLKDSRAAETIHKLNQDHSAADILHQKVELLGRRWLERPLNDEEREDFKAALASLQEIYGDHIRIEDTELFPLAASLLPAEALQEIGREMAERRGL